MYGLLSAILKKKRSASMKVQKKNDFQKGREIDALRLATRDARESIPLDYFYASIHTSVSFDDHV